MSVVVKLSQRLRGEVGGHEQIRLYTKGADSVLLALLEPGSRGADAASMETLNTTLHDWADVALRTLVFAKREISASSWDEWHVKYGVATCSARLLSHHRPPSRMISHDLPRSLRYDVATSSARELARLRQGKPNEISRLQMELECDLTLQGATAIEDKLQGGVPEILQVNAC